MFVAVAAFSVVSSRNIRTVVLARLPVAWLGLLEVLPSLSLLAAPSHLYPCRHGTVRVVRVASLLLRRRGTGVTTAAVLRRLFAVLGTPSLAAVLRRLFAVLGTPSLATVISPVDAVAVAGTGAILFALPNKRLRRGAHRTVNSTTRIRLAPQIVVGTDIVSSASLSPCLSP
ncbi:hypothetical protein GN244_ATG02012 [Phytophthora infestans]|uniref:Uncharacterized protein n=1 Tax=Phytophthora infestans TaxID=4787 RepID=A0A833TCV3_PHYIN|nr:hypothetical protein GN244_ATG02012 [Phytophthora infestans]KAF4128984.1 hypothetical protein GN958_ATG21815 [Phytophthora infestans]